MLLGCWSIPLPGTRDERPAIKIHRLKGTLSTSRSVALRLVCYDSALIFFFLKEPSRLQGTMAMVLYSTRRYEVVFVYRNGATPVCLSVNIYAAKPEKRIAFADLDCFDCL